MYFSSFYLSFVTSRVYVPTVAQLAASRVFACLMPMLSLLCANCAVMFDFKAQHLFYATETI